MTIGKRKIPFNKPAIVGNELRYIIDALDRGHLAGNGFYTRRCHAFFKERYGFKAPFLTTAGTTALEMAALLLEIRPRDEILMPSFTFVSTANAFMLHEARIVFADSESETPNLDVSGLETLVTEKTRAVVPVHYGGVACDMDRVMALAQRYGLRVVEDAAQAIEATYKGRPLGTFGHLAAFSFHETKNVISGEGGMLVVEDLSLAPRAEIVWEKGTNRAAFFRGEIRKYEWIDLGSSFLPSELTAAFLYGQLECLDRIQEKRMRLWHLYREGLAPLETAGKLRLPSIPLYAGHNGHIFYILVESAPQRDALILHLKEKGITAIFHYQALHRSPFYRDKHDGRPLPHADRYSECLIRLPLFFAMEESDAGYVIDSVRSFF